MTNGAVYIVTQNPRYVGLLLTSAASLKRAMPDLPITVFSQFPVESSLFEKVERVEPSQDGFYDKTRLIRNSPYERTLLVDADTYVLEPVPDLFSLLDHFDCAATHEEYVSTDWHNRYPQADIPVSFPEFNTGVLMLKHSDGVNAMLQDWGRLYEEFLREKPGEAINDQPFFRVAAYRSNIRIATLPREYNCKFRGQGYLNGAVKILHGHIRFEPNADFMLGAAGILNASTKPRVYIAGNVYEQKLIGRFADRRKAHSVGSFSLQPEPGIVAEARGFVKRIRQLGIRNVISRLLGRASRKASVEVVRQ